MKGATYMDTLAICGAIQNLIDYSVDSELITKDDIFVIRNQLMDVMGVSDWQDNIGYVNKCDVDDILEDMVRLAVDAELIEDTANNRDLFDTRIMGVLTPLPREIIAKFRSDYAVSPKLATDNYYDISKMLNYVRAGRIAKDLKWTYDCDYGTLDITVNCSKPEKDPRDIAAAKTAVAASYPKCQLCAENAGYAGRADHPARQNLRPIPMSVNGENWQIQYSPYGYYNEHCIVFNSEHIPMKIDDAVFLKLFDIINYLPHYFVGSNADLPIVGGSILSHEHFQGGNYTFAMARAEIETPIKLPKYPKINAGIVKWPMSVIRVASADMKELAACCADILEKWRGYTDEDAFILAETDGTPHNTITPIARKRGDMYECDLVLRNNITTDERPLGVYHPNPALHHIKKENIGLIEVMGLAVLPARLKQEIELLADALVNKGVSAVREDDILEKHADWVEEFASRREITATNVYDVIRDEIGAVFLEVLMDAGVYKRTDEGKAAFMRFIETL